MKIRDASVEAETLLQEVLTEQWSRYDVYLAFKAFADAEEAKPTLKGEQDRYLKRVMRDFRRKGLHLDEETRNKILDMNKQCNNLSIQALTHIAGKQTSWCFVVFQKFERREH